MGISLKIAVPQSNPSLPAVRMSSVMPSEASHELPSRTTVTVLGAVGVFMLHRVAAQQQDSPTVGDVIAFGTFITSTTPLVLQTSDIDQPNRPNADDYWFAPVTGQLPGDVRIIG